MIYVIRQNSDPPMYKIGYSKDPSNRLKTLQTANPCSLEIVKLIPGDISLERSLQEKFGHLREAREWFRDDAELRRWIYPEIDSDVLQGILEGIEDIPDTCDQTTLDFLDSIPRFRPQDTGRLLLLISVFVLLLILICL